MDEKKEKIPNKFYDMEYELASSKKCGITDRYGIHFSLNNEIGQMVSISTFTWEQLDNLSTLLSTWVQSNEKKNFPIKFV